MARTPSLSADEAAALIGPKGTQCTSENRGLFKKWLVAMGLPSDFVGGLSLIEMGLAYRDDAGLEKVRNKFAKSRDEDGPEGPTDRETPPAISLPLPAPAADQDVLALLRKLLGSSVDAETVKRIMRDELPGMLGDLSPVRRIEIDLSGIKKDLPAKPRHNLFERVLRMTAINEPVFLCGGAGGGKTTLAEQIAEALDLPFYLQGACTGAHEFMGYVTNGRYQSTPFRQAYEHGGVFLCDEIDGGDAGGILSINAALANGQQSFPDTTNPIKAHKDFRLIAAANTFGRGADQIYIGRNQLDGATLDRFYFLSFDYDEKLERLIAGHDKWVNRVQALRAGVLAEKARMVISPRASIKGAKALAAGEIWSDVEDALIWKGCDSELRRRIEQHATGAN